MVGTWYVKVRNTYTYELPNPCMSFDLERAIGYMQSQLVSRGHAHVPSPQIRADEEHIYVEIELDVDTKQIDNYKKVDA